MNISAMIRESIRVNWMPKFFHSILLMIAEEFLRYVYDLQVNLGS